MTLALVDVPVCLKVRTSYVGPPRVLVDSGGGRPTAWADAMPWSGTAAFREQAVKECLDTIAVLRTYREPLEGETWLIPAASERRLLAQVNVIISLGPLALTQVMELALDADVPDPGRVFAALLVLGCVEGREWIGPARDLFVAATLRHASEAAAAAEALSLSPNPQFAPFLASLLGDERPRIRAGALRVLAFRGALREAEWTTAMSDRDATGVAAALSAPLRGYDRAVCERALQPLFAEREDERLARLALRAGLSLQLDTAHDCAVQIARRDASWADAARSLAMFGYLGDVRYIRAAIGGTGLQDSLRGAAILGSIDLVPDLLEVIHRDSAAESAGVARQALATVTGLPFVSTADAPQALRLWSQHSSNFEPGVRYRHGRPWGLEVLMQSLRTGPGARSDRQDIYLEMLAATKSRVPRFSAYDFVGIQAQSLRRIEQWLGDPQMVQPNAATVWH